MEKGALDSGKANQFENLALSLTRERVISTRRKESIFPSPNLKSAPPPVGEGTRTLEIRPKDGFVDFFLVQAGANRKLCSGASATLEVFRACDWSSLEVCGQAATERSHLHFSYHTGNICLTIYEFRKVFSNKPVIKIYG